MAHVACFGSFLRRSLGVESRTFRKPMQTLRLLLKFHDTVSVAVGRAQGQVDASGKGLARTALLVPRAPNGGAL